MIVYRNASSECRTASELTRLSGFRDGDATDLLVETGALEQGLLDALQPTRDSWGAVQARLRALTLAAAGALLSRLEQRSPAPDLAALQGGLEALRALPLPARIQLKPPEGYVQYGLSPAAFVQAARGYRSEVGPERATRAVVVGVRSIGTSLSAAVAATLGSRCSLTVRPRGESGARRIVADERLSALLVGWLASEPDVLVVDEGPGITGETFAVLGAWLRELGVPDQRQVLFPTRTWGMELAPEARRRWFQARRSYPAPWDDDRPLRLAARLGADQEPRDLSAGRWREIVPGAAGEVACIGHERRKLLATRGGSPWLQIRYAGLARWGEQTARRAQALAASGAGPALAAHQNGYLALSWVAGRPARRGAASDPAFVAALGRYLCARAPLFRTAHAVDVEPVIGLLLENAREALGPDAPGLAAAVRRLERLPPRPAVVADARLQPREWVQSAAGYQKVDALDHGDSLRLPGPTDAAWDLAAAAIEYALPEQLLDELIARCAAAGADSPAELRAAVAAYRAPYAACQLGDAVLSSHEASTEADRRALAAEARYYCAALETALSRGAAA